MAKPPVDPTADIRSGELACSGCKARYPILAGIALLVPDVRGYLLEHVKGIARQVPDLEIPSAHRAAFAAARLEVEQEHIEDDLEAERVNALYVMTHYLKAQGGDWWKPAQSEDPGSPVLQSVIHDYWDQGPISRITNEMNSRPETSLIELGCGAGGLFAALSGKLERYLGIDSSFASIALARHLALGAPYAGEVQFPGDLLEGPVSRAASIPKPFKRKGCADFLVCDVEHPPLQRGRWQISAALNLIDMMEKPEALPKLQGELLKSHGLAIQSCPYIWHPSVARRLQAKLPAQIRQSAPAVEWLYGQAGFSIERRELHVPWLFFKHLRQLEIYSVHLFFARKNT